MAAEKWSDWAAGGALAGTEQWVGLEGSVNKRWLVSQMATFIIAQIVDSAPSTLDTLNELAAAMDDDPNFAATITAALAGKQPLDTDLTAIAALVSAADKVPYATGAGTWALADFKADIRALAAAASMSALRTAAGLAIGTDVQAYGANIAPPIPSGRMMLFEGTGIGIAAAVAPGADSLRAYAARLRRAVTITELRVRITTVAAGGNFQIAIYADDGTTESPTGAPLYSSGSFSTGSLGVAGPTGLSLALPSGVYWLCVICDTLAAAAVFVAGSVNSREQAELTGAMTDANAFAGNANVTGFSKAHTFGTWPTLTGSRTTDGFSDVVTASTPVLGYKT